MEHISMMLLARSLYVCMPPNSCSDHAPSQPAGMCAVVASWCCLTCLDTQLHPPGSKPLPQVCCCLAVKRVRPEAPHQSLLQPGLAQHVQPGQQVAAVRGVRLQPQHQQ
jgi:hypothetical protein